MNSSAAVKNQVSYESTGERLSHILDQIGFKKDRGRMPALQNLLDKECPEFFEGVSYSTVRSWFANSTPPMKKVDAIIEALSKHYQFDCDLSHVKTWWKLGGFNPFEETAISPASIEAEKESEKFKIYVTGLVAEEAGDRFAELSADELMIAQKRAIKFAKDYANPFETDCPEQYIRALVRDALMKSS